jgi:hypothetical protein
MTPRGSERDRLPIAVRGHVQKRGKSLPFNSRVDTIAFDAAEKLSGDMVGFFEPITGHVAATVTGSVDSDSTITDTAAVIKAMQALFSREMNS